MLSSPFRGRPGCFRRGRAQARRLAPAAVAAPNAPDAAPRPTVAARGKAHLYHYDLPAGKTAGNRVICALAWPPRLPQAAPRNGVVVAGPHHRGFTATGHPSPCSARRAATRLQQKPSAYIIAFVCTRDTASSWPTWPGVVAETSRAVGQGRCTISPAPPSWSRIVYALILSRSHGVTSSTGAVTEHGCVRPDDHLLRTQAPSVWEWSIWPPRRALATEDCASCSITAFR